MSHVTPNVLYGRQARAPRQKTVSVHGANKNRADRAPASDMGSAARNGQPASLTDRLAWWVDVDREHWAETVQHEQLRMNPIKAALDYRHAHKRAQD